MILDRCDYKQIEKWGTEIQGEEGSVKKLQGWGNFFLSFQKLNLV